MIKNRDQRDDSADDQQHRVLDTAPLATSQPSRFDPLSARSVKGLREWPVLSCTALCLLRVAIECMETQRPNGIAVKVPKAAKGAGATRKSANARGAVEALSFFGRA